MPAQEALQTRVEEEAQENLARVAQHHDERHQRPAGATDGDMRFLVAAGVPLSRIKHVAPDASYSFGRGKLQTEERLAWRSTNRWKSFDVKCLRNRLSSAVAAQVRAAGGRRVAVLLSGGIDSTIIAHEAAKVGVREAWTIAVHEEAPDALAVRTVAQRLGLDWTLGDHRAAGAGDRHSDWRDFRTGASSKKSRCRFACSRSLTEPGCALCLRAPADEVFVGYTHLFGRVHVTEMQQRFVSSHYRFDLCVQQGGDGLWRRA